MEHALVLGSALLALAQLQVRDALELAVGPSRAISDFKVYEKCEHQHQDRKDGLQNNEYVFTLVVLNPVDHVLVELGVRDRKRTPGPY
jgi:hypothetical protein